jgi:phosphatidylserine/phosphatidylglycerophosphate/cardiolipin synthase-like enzyme
VYFAELLTAVRAQQAGDLLLFTDWRGDPDEPLDTSSSPSSEIGAVLCEAAERGVIVKGLIWRSHLDRLQFSESENRHLGEEIEAAGGQCLLDMRVRPGGSHHQKFVVLRHPDRPERDIAFVGGIDLCHSRRDDATHRGDPLSQPFAAAYGPRPPWHDIQVAIQGPAVGDVEATFRERWQDPAPPQPQPPEPPSRTGAPPGHHRRPATRATTRPRAPRKPRRPTAAHLPGTPPRLPLRPARGTQHRPRLPKGALPA